MIILNKYFNKSKITLIKAIEYIENNYTIKVLLQIVVEKVIINDNSKRFILVYSSSLLHEDMLKNFRLQGEKKVEK